MGAVFLAAAAANWAFAGSELSIARSDASHG